MKPFRVVRDAVTREVKTGGQNRWLGFLTTSLPSQPSDYLDFPLTSFALRPSDWLSRHLYLDR